MKWSIRNKKQWTRNSPEEASTWLAPPHEAETFSGSNVCNRNHFFLPLNLRDDDDCSESPRVPTAQLRRLVFFASPTSLFPKTPPSLHQSPNIPPFTSLVHVLAKETFWYFSSIWQDDNVGAQNLRDQVGTVLAPPRELAARFFSGPKSARVILVLKAVLYVGSKSWWSQRLFWKITSNDALMFTYSNTSLSLNSLLSDKVFTSHLWSAWPWRCNDIFDLL